MNVLFVCSRNQWRSPMAEQVYRNDPRFRVRSAGVSDKARRRLTEGDLEWADVVLAMERAHRSRIVQAFGHLELPPIEILDIPDDFAFMDPELVELITQATEEVLGGHLPG